MPFSCAANELCLDPTPVPARKLVEVSVALVAVSVTLNAPATGVAPKSPIVNPVRNVPRFTLRFEVGAVSALHAPAHPVHVPVTVRFPLTVTGVLKMCPIPESSSVQLLLVPPALFGNAPRYQ